MLQLESSYHDGASGFMFRVADLDGDVERSLLGHHRLPGQEGPRPSGGRQRRGLLAGMPFGPDTITVLGAIELGLPDLDLRGRCTSLRIQDLTGTLPP